MPTLESRKVVRVLYIAPDLRVGGAQRQLLSLIQNLDRNRFAPCLCLLDDGGRLLDELSDTECVVLSRGRSVDLKTIIALQSIIRRKRPHIIHTWQLIAGFYGRISRFMSTIPVLIGSERGMFEREVSVLRRWGHLLGRSLTEPLSDLTVANSVALKRHLSDTGVAASRIRVVHNGFDFGRLPKIDHRSRNLREEIGLPESTRVVGTIARLDRDKDLGTFLSAAALTVQRVGDVHFVVVGGGDPSYGDELVELSRRLNLSDRVRFTGERSDALALLAQFDVLVLTSRMESFPNALMEGMALSKPIVATCVGGVPELVVDGVTGFLCPPGDPIAFSERLCAVLSDKETALSLGRNGNIRLRERFSVDCMVKAYSDLYRDQLYRPRRS